MSTLPRSPTPLAGDALRAAQTTVAVGMLIVAGLVLLALPPAEGAGAFPADLLWRFRLASLATQLILLLGTAVGFGLLSVRHEQRSPDGIAAPA